jgi:hypothetical protein
MTPTRWLRNKRLARAERKLWLAMHDADKDMRAKELGRGLDRLRNSTRRQLNNLLIEIEYGYRRRP